MSLPRRPIAFVLAATNHGTLIVNRNDHHMVTAQGGYGVGLQLLTQSSFDESEVDFALGLLDRRRRHFGDGVVALDGGANIGVHTVEWARHMHGWGSVVSYEAQEVVFYALAGNITLNNCLNARAKLSALGRECGEMTIPVPDYFQPASFGSLELRRREGGTEFIGQSVSYEAGVTVPVVSLDSLQLARLDLVKLDVEGMEMDVLQGAQRALGTFKPVMIVEVLKSDRAAIEAFLGGLGYRIFPAGINVIAVHQDDPTLGDVKNDGSVLYLA